ncbi:MAG: response regulator [Myxococcales bacterium]|nr:response regulator [Myxococcales bacterium]
MTVGARQSLLLVDADPQSLRVLDVSLKKAGYDVLTAPSGAEALARLAEHPIDLVISDTHMPEMDGFELCRRIKESAEWARIPFIFVSSRKAIEDKIRGLEIGVEDYLIKPVYIKELTTRVRMLLQRRERERLESRRDTRTRFAGELADIGVVDLVQTIEVNRKSGIVHVTNADGRRADIYFREGRVIDAEAGRQTGVEAVYRLFAWTDGSFEVEFKNIRRRDVIELSAQAMLVEGMRRLDEWARLLETLPPLETVFEVDYQALAERLADIPDEVNALLRLFDGRRSLLQVIEDGDFSDLEALAIVCRLRDDKVIGEARGEPRPEAEPRQTRLGRLERWLSESPWARERTPPPVAEAAEPEVAGPAEREAADAPSEPEPSPTVDEHAEEGESADTPEAGDEDSTDTRDEDNTDTRDEDSTDTRDEDNTDARDEDSTDAGNEDSTDTRDEDNTDARDEDNTDARDEDSTDARDEDSTDARDEDSTDARDEDSTDAGDPVALEAEEARAEAPVSAHGDGEEEQDDRSAEAAAYETEREDAKTDAPAWDEGGVEAAAPELGQSEDLLSLMGLAAADEEEPPEPEPRPGGTNPGMAAVADDLPDLLGAPTGRTLHGFAPVLVPSPLPEPPSFEADPDKTPSPVALGSQPLEEGESESSAALGEGDEALVAGDRAGAEESAEEGEGQAGHEEEEARDDKDEDAVVSAAPPADELPDLQGREAHEDLTPVLSALANLDGDDPKALTAEAEPFPESPSAVEGTALLEPEPPAVPEPRPTPPPPPPAGSSAADLSATLPRRSGSARKDAADLDLGDEPYRQRRAMPLVVAAMLVGAVVGFVVYRNWKVEPLMATPGARPPASQQEPGPTEAASTETLPAVELPDPVAERPSAAPEAAPALAGAGAPPVAPSKAPAVRDKPAVDNAPTEGSPTAMVAPEASSVSETEAALEACRKAYGRERYKPIMTACRKALSLRPDDARLMVMLAHAELDRGHSGAALRWARKAVAADPKIADAYVFIGEVEQEGGNKDGARAAYRRYLELEPNGRYARDLRVIVQNL